MLLDKDIDIVKNDGELPGLIALLDNRFLQERLKSLPQFTDLHCLSTEYLRYKPATSCVATLSLQFADGRRQYLFAKALTKSRFLVSWLHPKRQKLVKKQDPFAPMAFHELGIILSYPQQDRALPQLWLLNASPQRDDLFRQWLPGLSANAEIDIQVLRYKPERRLLALLHSDGQPRAVLRFASDGRYDAMMAGNQLGQTIGEITLQAVLPEHRLIITEWIAGQTLCPEQGGNLQETDLYNTGRQLAAIHQRDLSSPVALLAETGIKAAQSVLNTLYAVCPELDVFFAMQLDHLDKKIGQYYFSAALIHGDFSIDQVVRSAADGQLRIIDWDRARRGNPASDLATFQARIELQVIEGIVSRRQAQRAIAAFHAGYAEQRNELPQYLNEYTALAMLQLAAEPFRKRTSGWSQQIAALLMRAYQFLGGWPESMPDKYLPRLLSREQMVEPLVAALKLPPTASLNNIEIIASKPGRRAVLTYQFFIPERATSLSVVGKYRCKGVNQHGYAVQQALWRGGFSDNAAVVVPEPLAVLPEFNLWLQRKVAGQCMTHLLFPENPRLYELGYRAGRALARIQNNTASRMTVVEKAWTLQDELKILHQRLTAASNDRPAWATRIARIAMACEQLLQLLSPAHSVFVHRDFYPAQLLVTDERPGQIVVLDFDLSASGPAALDVGNYLAHLQEQALRCWGDVRALETHEQAFIDGWHEEGQPVAEQAIEVFTFLALARHIGISLLFPERHSVTESLLSLCEQRLDDGFSVRGGG